MFSTAFQYFCINFPFFPALHSLSAAFPFLSTKIQNENLYPFGTRPDNERKWYPSRGLSSSSNAMRFFFPFFLSLSCVSSFLGRRSKKCLPERGIGPGPVDALFSVIEPRRNPRKRNSWDRFWELTSLFFLHKFWKDLHSSPYDWSRTKEKIMCVCFFFCCLSERRVITTLAEHGELIADSLNSDGDTGKDPGGIKLLAAACRRRNWS